MNPFRLLPALALSLSLLAPAWADDPGPGGIESIERRTLGEVRDFLTQHLPEALEQLRRVEKHDDGAAVDEFWSEAATFVGEYFHTRELLGEEAAGSFLKLRRIEAMADVLTEQFHDSDDESAREEIKKKLREVIGSHLTESLNLEKAHLDHARQELNKAERELERTLADRNGIINDELKQRLYARDEQPEDDHTHRESVAETEELHEPEQGEDQHPVDKTAEPADPGTSDGENDRRQPDQEKNDQP